MEKKIIPSFYGLRIYLSSIILYFFLVFPFIGFIVFQNIPRFIENRGGTNQVAASIDSVRNSLDTIAEMALDDGAIMFNPKEVTLEDARAVLRRAWA